MADANLAVTFSASVDSLTAGVAEVKDALSGLSGPIGEMNARYANLGASLSQALSPHKAQEFGAAMQASASVAAAAQVAAKTLTGQGANRAAADMRAAAMEEAQEEVRLTEVAANQKISLYNDEYRRKAITEDQKVQLTLNALQDELQDETDTLNQELALDDLRPQQRQRILDQLATLEQNYAMQVQKIQQDSAAYTAQQWQSAFNSINGACDSQVKGLLAGTTTWSTALRDALTTLTSDLITFFLNWGLKWTENELLQLTGINTVTAAQVAGSAQQAAAQASAGATGALANIGNILHSIEASAAQTFAGVTGFMAPILGPAAPAAGAAAEATVLAVAGGLYDAGAWEIPHDMLAGVHAGEMVIPQRGGVADEFRNFMSGGGFSGAAGSSGAGAPVHIHPTANFNVSAVDSASTAQWFRNNSAGIAKAMNEAARQGALLGLRRLASA